MVMDLSPDPRHPDKDMRARGWTRSIRSIGGYWQGEFTLSGKPQELANFFYNNLSCHLEEWSHGFKTWEGLIYEMELVTYGGSRRRSLDDMYNSVQVRYMDPETDEVKMTSVATNDLSIMQYGRRGIIFPMAGQKQTFAGHLRDKILAESAFPWARPINKKTGEEGTATLLVRACGYVFTANWRIESASNNSSDQVSDWIILIIRANCPLLKEGMFTRNEELAWKKNPSYMRAWDVITKLLEVGIDEKPARIYVDNDRYVYYEKIDTLPKYYNRGGMLFGSANSLHELDPWSVKPAVVRDSEYPMFVAEPGNWLSDNRDWYMSEVVVSDNGDGTVRLDPRSEDYEEADILSNLDQMREQFQRYKEEKKADKKAKEEEKNA